MIVTLFGVGAVIGAVLALRFTPRRPMIACGVAFIAASCQPVITSVGVLPIGYAIVGPLADFAGLHTTMYIASAVKVAA